MMQILPPPTARLAFRRMGPSDLDEMFALLGDPDVMTYYPEPKTREGAAAWIAQNEGRYAQHGHGLWIIETLHGDLVGDCGLTWQSVNGEPRLEVGYHVRKALQGQGYATEAAAACRDLARAALQAPELLAIIHPENSASRRVAQKIGMRHSEDDLMGSIPVRHVMQMDLATD